MSATNTLEESILAKLFNNDDDAMWTALESATEFYISLHTADPGETGDQDTSETAYTGYARQAVARADWTLAGSLASNTNEITFPACTASPGGPITHVGIGLFETSTGSLLMRHLLDTPLTMQVGTVPIFSASTIETGVD